LDAAEVNPAGTEVQLQALPDTSAVPIEVPEPKQFGYVLSIFFILPATHMMRM
jgi:hypothetical protein